MARRMGKTADDQYMGGGSGNFNKKKEPAKKAEKKERVAPPKPRAKPAKEPAKAKKSAPPKPRAKPAQPKKEAPKRTAKDKDATPKAGSARKAVSTSGASRSTAGKEDRGFVARVVRGTKRVTGNARNVVSRGFKRNRPR